MGKAFVSFIIVFSITFCSLIAQENKESVWELAEGIEFKPFEQTLEVVNQTGSGYGDSINFAVRSTSSISDSEGVLFYSDGLSLFDRNHSITPNGRFLTGDGFLWQSSLIVPTLDSNLFYLFTVGNGPESVLNPSNVDVRHVLAYSVIDRRHNLGEGDIILEKKNQFILTHWHHGMASISGGCENTWLVFVDHNEIKLFELVNDSLIQSEILPRSLPINRSDVGIIKVSPDGSRMALITILGSNRFAHLYSFDVSTGVFTDMGTLLEEREVGLSAACFDHMNNLYVSKQSGTTQSLVKFDCSLENINQIRLSEDLIADDVSNSRDLKRANNDLIYSQNGRFIGLIDISDQEIPIYVDSIMEYSVVQSLGSTFPSDISCMKEDTLHLLNLPFSDTTVCLGESIQVDLRSLSDYVVEVNDELISDSVLVLGTGEYFIAISDEACIIFDTIIVSEITECDCEIYVPNVFSPNLDNVNDGFVVSSNCEIDNFMMIIFDKWGNKVFDSSSIIDIWDGNYLGRQSAIGVYAVYIEYYQNNQLFRCVNDVLLIR